MLSRKDHRTNDEANKPFKNNSIQTNKSIFGILICVESECVWARARATQRPGDDGFGTTNTKKLTFWIGLCVSSFQGTVYLLAVSLAPHTFFVRSFNWTNLWCSSKKNYSSERLIKWICRQQSEECLHFIECSMFIFVKNVTFTCTGIFYTLRYFGQWNARFAIAFH